MMIQSSYGISAYSGIAALSAQRQTSRITQAMTAAAPETAEQVTLSDAGKALAAREDAPVRRRTPVQEETIREARADPEFAKVYAEFMARETSVIACTLNEKRGDEPLRLYSNGKFADDAYTERFYREAAVVDAQRRALYESEKQKGTDPAEIIAKMIDFTNAQSYAYREATNKGYWADEVPGQAYSGSGVDVFNGTALLMEAQKRAIYENEKIKETETAERLCKWMASEEGQVEES